MAEHDNEELARRFSDGLIAEWIYCEDTLGVFAQLGALPAVLSGGAGPDHAG
jgi:hypothetical protein